MANATQIWIAGHGGTPRGGATPVWVAAYGGPPAGPPPSGLLQAQMMGHGHGGPAPAGTTPVWIMSYGGPPPGGATPIWIGGVGGALATGAPPVNTVLPAVTGTATVGGTLTCSTGTWTNSPTFYAYQWLRNGANIAGATSLTYVLQTADGGASVSCSVTATNAGGSASATSNAVSVPAVVVVTWNPADIASATLSNGNLTITQTSTTAGGVRSTTSKTGGKWHFELTAVHYTANDVGAGVANAAYLLGAAYLGHDINSVGIIYMNVGAATKVYCNAATIGSFNSSMATGDVIVIEIDLTNKLVWVQDLNTDGGYWNGSTTANPATGVGGFSFGAQLTGAGPFFAALQFVSGVTGGICTANFGGSPFALTPSAGFLSWQ